MTGVPNTFALGTAMRRLCGLVASRLASYRRHRADMARWAEATTLAELGERTALWLEGELLSQPGYQPGAGPDAETVELIPVLAYANRAGLVTHGSQPGRAPTLGPDGNLWEQRAAVDGFVDEPTLRRLRQAVAGTALRLTAGPAPQLFRDYSDARPVTFRSKDGLVATEFGTRIPRRWINFLYDGCSEEALEALHGAWQVAITDPEPGRNDVLWPALVRFARDAEIGARP